MEFPRLRLKQAGATEEELSKLEAEFDGLPAAQQSVQLAQWAGVSNAELSEWVESWRHPQVATEAELEEASSEDTEPDEKPDEKAQPAASSSSTPGKASGSQSS